MGPDGRRGAGGWAARLLAAGVLALAFGAAAEARTAGGLAVVEPPRYAPGTVVIRTGERRLYLVQADGSALSWPVAVGKPGMAWTGLSRIDGVHLRPAWSPPAEVKRDNPALPDVIPGGAPGNPMGVAALTLEGGDYAIHGTNRPDSIGRAASYGCFRMRNADVLDLVPRVRVGTNVVVLH